MQRFKEKMLLTLGLLIVGFNLGAQNFPLKPQPARYVNDFAGMLSLKEEQSLEQILFNYQDSTSTQIVIVIIESLEGANLEEYSVGLAQYWGIGQKDQDNGILILVSKQDREVRIEIGYGLEALMSDFTAKQIIEKEILPKFKQQAYYEGLRASVDKIFSLISGEFQADEIYASDGVEGTWVGRIISYTTSLLLLSFVLLSPGQIHSSSHSLARRNSLIAAVILILGIVLIEVSFWGSSHGPGYWLLLIFFILAVLGSYFVWFLLWGELVTNYKKIEKDLSSDKPWAELKEFFYTGEVEKKRAELQSRFAALKMHYQDRASILALSRELIAVKSLYTNSYFTSRSDRALQELAKRLSFKDSLLKDIAFTPASREYLTRKLEEELEYFESRSEEKISDQDKERMHDFLRFFKKVQKKPLNYLKVDKEAIKENIENYLDNEKAWEKFSKKYTQASIQKTRTNFRQEYQELKSKTREQDWYYFYRLKIERIQKNPGYHLEAIPRSSDRKTGYSSYGSSSSSGSSFSSSSFGGGSFGGGGASGGW